MSKDKFLGKVSRRRFLAGTAGVLGAASAARGLDRKDPEHPVHDGFVIGCRLNRCPVCGRLHGHVLERDNGRIPVLCKCERTSKDVTSMSSTRRDELVWTPTTYHRGSDGRLLHTPYFVGFRLS